MDYKMLKSFLRFFGYQMNPVAGINDFTSKFSGNCFLQITEDQICCFIKDGAHDLQKSLLNELGESFQENGSNIPGFKMLSTTFRILSYEHAVEVIRFLQSGFVDGFFVDQSYYIYQDLLILEKNSDANGFAEKSTQNRIQVFQQAVDHGCSDPILINYLGKMYAELGDATAASKCFVKACEINPYYAEPFSNMGAMMWQVDAKDKGFKLFSEALLRCPFDQSVQDNFIKSGMETGEFETMNFIIDKTRDFFPDFEDLLYLKAVLLEKMGRYQDSISILETMKNKHPDNDMVGSFLNDLQQKYT